MGQRNRKSIVRPPIEAARWSKTSIPTAALTAALGQAIANNRSLSFTLTAPPASGNEVSDVRKTRNCAFRKSYPNVMVVQARQDWDSYNDPGPLHCPT
jgi:hypothetical protein